MFRENVLSNNSQTEFIQIDYLSLAFKDLVPSFTSTKICQCLQSYCHMVQESVQVRQPVNSSYVVCLMLFYSLNRITIKSSTCIKIYCYFIVYLKTRQRRKQMIRKTKISCSFLIDILEIIYI